VKALLSVYDKSGIVALAMQLSDAGIDLISTGGTHRTLVQDGKLKVRQVSDITGSPEILDGRVKTLHPTIYAGLLARRDSPSHLAELKQYGIDPIDLVVVNLYPFLDTVRKPGVTLEEALENIDIGGPSMLRAAAKNFPSVTVIVDPTDYGWVADKINGPGLTIEDRRQLAGKAFFHVSAYDNSVARYLSPYSGSPDNLPERFSPLFTKVSNLRYGENPHQAGAVYMLTEEFCGGVAAANQLHGRELSFNNLMDADAAWRIVTDFLEPTVVILKHGNPCGLASHENQTEAYSRAYQGDPISAFGGIVAYNRTVTVDAARHMSSIFFEVIIAPAYDPDAIEVLTKKRNLRILSVESQTGAATGLDLRTISGGILVQTPDTIKENPDNWKTTTDRAPTTQELRDLVFAWKAAKHVKSNAIVLAKDRTLMGMGAGQPNRVVSVHLSQRAAGHHSLGCVLASDAFFPFPDNIELAAEAGVTAIVQPGGSIRDDEIIEAANKYNLTMVFTGVRHFRH
jgi:phosphoribosylaminoimidazolecarboxamide formyltransferase/IMP cyclohydrolase